MHFRVEIRLMLEKSSRKNQITLKLVDYILYKMEEELDESKCFLNSTDLTLRFEINNCLSVMEYFLYVDVIIIISKVEFIHHNIINTKT